MQSHKSTFADSARRWSEMATPITRLCLFLHPGYRFLSKRKGELDDLKFEAMNICLGRSWGEGVIRNLFGQMDAYNSNTKDYQRPLTAGSDPDEWCDVVGKALPKEADDLPAIISVLARLLLSTVPHAADPERAFSAMGLDHSPIRNRFNKGTVSNMALVRSYHRVAPPDEEIFKPKEEKKDKPAKQPRQVDAAAAAGSLRL
ncbi:hypothetical protein WJX77_010992 [Trebouxia sp. C0004]